MADHTYHLYGHSACGWRSWKVDDEPIPKHECPELSLALEIPVMVVAVLRSEHRQFYAADLTRYREALARIAEEEPHRQAAYIARAALR